MKKNKKHRGGKVINRGRQRRRKIRKEVKVEKYYSYRGRWFHKLLRNVSLFFLEYVQFNVIHLYSVGGDVQHTGSRWRHKKDVPSDKETFI